MKTLIATGWNFMRILRLVMGIAVIVFAVRNHDRLLGLAGGFLVLMSVLNIGCSGAGSCATPTRNHKKKSAEAETINYDEVV